MEDLIIDTKCKICQKKTFSHSCFCGWRKYCSGECKKADLNHKCKKRPKFKAMIFYNGHLCPYEIFGYKKFKNHIEEMKNQIKEVEDYTVITPDIVKEQLEKGITDMKNNGYTTVGFTHIWAFSVEYLLTKGEVVDDDLNGYLTFFQL